jgi:hypothetical protein
MIIKSMPPPLSTRLKLLYISRSKSGKPAPFIEEQVEAIKRNNNISVRHFLIQEGDIKGYLNAVVQLHRFIKDYKPDIVHVHYGLSGIVAVLNKFLFLKPFKIIITFHGSDINKKSERRFSLFAARFSAHNILVSEKMAKYFKGNYSVIPCGINTDVELIHREVTRESNKWGTNDFVILFSSSFDREEKDANFAFQVVDAFSKTTTKSVRLIELKGYTRNEVTHLMQAADALIMCSKREGSPQVIKEAILNSLPVVSNDVGEVKSICSGIDHCFIVPKEVDEFVKSLQFLSMQNVRIQNRNPVFEKFDNTLISSKIFTLYNQLCPL